VAKTVVIDPGAGQGPAHPFKHWLLAGLDVKGTQGPHTEEKETVHPWWKVMCLTGVDYFSTLGYQPGIAFVAAGTLSPLATLVLVILTLFGALPIYRHVANQSPHGEGSIAMLEHLLTWWKGKLFVLTLLGFASTDFMITITLSAADASAHLIQNPLVPRFFQGQAVPITLFLVALLGAVFLKGFKEAIGIAVALVGGYLALNLIVVVIGLQHIAADPRVFADWKTALFSAHGSPLGMIGTSLLLFPKLALGLSGFETGVSMMPLIKGAPDDKEPSPAGKIRNTHLLLFTAALIMSLFLLSTALITTLLIPADAFRASGANGEPAGPANGRALAYLAHEFLGDGFGSLYDLSTIAILWFAGASAMAGLLNIVPRYLPRYGMAPEWTRATRPLVLIYMAIGFALTLLFRADEDNNIPANEPIVFLEIYVRDASDFSTDLNIRGFEVGRHRVLRGESAAVANAIAGFLLYLRDDKAKIPHAYFNWTEGNPLLYLVHYVLSGEGDVAPVTREVLRKAEPNAQRRPAIHAGV
jgi:ABC-type multidrug transport system fused ATPase/permease subunit